MHDPDISPPAAFLQELQRAREQHQAGKLGLLAEESQGYPWRTAARRLVEEARTASAASLAFDHAILFTGHMIDAPGRPSPRFPPAAEPAAARAILRSIQTIHRAHPSTLGIAGGASGGDLLLHESCAELGIPTLLRLTLPPQAFLESSVAPAGPAWVRRFEALIARLGPSRIAVLGPSIQLPSWLTAREHYDVWQRTNLWIVHEALALAPARTLLALWDGETGDGPGGTGHLVKAAPTYGISVAPILDPATLTQQSPQ